MLLDHTQGSIGISHHHYGRVYSSYQGGVKAPTYLSQYSIHVVHDVITSHVKL